MVHVPPSKSLLVRVLSTWCRSYLDCSDDPATISFVTTMPWGPAHFLRPSGTLLSPNFLMIHFLNAGSLLYILQTEGRSLDPRIHTYLYIIHIVARLRIPSLILCQGSNPAFSLSAHHVLSIGPTGPGNSGPSLPCMGPRQLRAKLLICEFAFP